MSFIRIRAVARAITAIPVVISLCFTADVQAAGLTLTEALRRTLNASPALAVYPAQLRESDAVQLQAALRPAAELSLEAENLAGGGDYSGTDSAEYTLALRQTIELGGKRDQRLEVARWQRRSIEADYDIARADALAQAAARFVDCARAQAVLDWARQRQHWAERSVQSVVRRVNAGATSTAEATRIEIAALRARIAVARAESDNERLRAELAASWGGDAMDFSRVDANLQRLPEIAPQQQWMERLRAAPQLARYATQERLLAAQQQLVAREAQPDVTVSLGIRRLESGDEAAANALVLGASMPLAFAGRRHAVQTQAQAGYDRNLAEQQRASIETQTALRSLYQQLLITRREAQLLRNEALPKAQQAWYEFERGYAAGRFSTLELLTAQDEQLALERDAIDAEASFHQQWIALQQLTGLVVGEVSQ